MSVAEQSKKKTRNIKEAKGDGLTIVEDAVMQKYVQEKNTPRCFVVQISRGYAMTSGSQHAQYIMLKMNTMATTPMPIVRLCDLVYSAASAVHMIKTSSIPPVAERNTSLLRTRGIINEAITATTYEAMLIKPLIRVLSRAVEYPT